MYAMWYPYDRDDVLDFDDRVRNVVEEKEVTGIPSLRRWKTGERNVVYCDRGGMLSECHHIVFNVFMMVSNCIHSPRRMGKASRPAWLLSARMHFSCAW